MNIKHTIVPTLRVGMQPKTLCVLESVPQSGMKPVPTQSAGTINMIVGAGLVPAHLV